MEKAILRWADYLVIALTLCISVSIGVYYRLTGGRQKTIEEYFAANRSMSIIPVGIALMVSFMSAITLLGVSAENYTFGTQFVIINLSYLIGTPLVCYGFLPVFFKLQATSTYEYLEKRFGIRARILVSFIYWIQLLLYSGVVLYAPALALEATTGLSKNASIIIIGLVCAFYSSIGGIKAVLITDVFQALLMFVSLFVIIGMAARDAGGIGEIWKIAERGHRIEFDSISADPTVRHTWWSLTIGGLCTFLSLYGINQVQVQRLLTVRELSAARKALWLNWPILTVLSVATCFCGLAIYSKYYNCDPLTEGRITSTDMLMPLYVMDTMSHIPGLPGLFIAGIFSAGLSTISAALNSLAAVTIEDYVKPVYKMCTSRELAGPKMIITGKLLAFMYGVACVALAFLAQLLGGVLQASLTIFGVVGGPLLGIFTLGMGCESANEFGAVTSVSTSLIFLLWIAFGQPRPKPSMLPLSTEGCDITTSLLSATENVLQNSTASFISRNTDDSSYLYLYRISYMWYSPIGFVMTFVFGLLLSNLYNLFKRQENFSMLDPNLYFPVVGNRIIRRQRSGLANNESPNIGLQKKYTFNFRDGNKTVGDNTIL